MIGELLKEILNKNTFIHSKITECIFKNSKLSAIECEELATRIMILLFGEK